MKEVNIDYSHLYNKTYKNKVYLPSEDTFFFTDQLEEEFKSIAERNPKIILELGSGSGYISTFLLKMFKSKYDEAAQSGEKMSIPFLVATDINELANSSTSLMIKENNLDQYCDVVRMDLLQNFVKNKFDLIMFNPPYVPGNKDDSCEAIDLAWNGGKDGTETILRFLNIIDKHLAKGGNAYMIIEDRNVTDDVLKVIQKKSLDFFTISRKRLIGEELIFVKICYR